MAKEYEHIYGDQQANMNLDGFVKMMTDFHEQGRLVIASFHAQTFQSDEITLDNAYFALTGLTYDKFNSLTHLVNKAYDIIDVSKIDDFEQDAYTSFKCTWNGEDVECCLKIVDALNNGLAFEDVRKLLDAQNHPEGYLEDVLELVAEFHQDGVEFAKYAEPIERQLQKEAILGDLREHGATIVGEQHVDEWNNMLDGVTELSYNFFQCSDKYDCLEIVAALNEGYDFDIVAEILEDQNHSSNDIPYVVRDVARLCDRGEDFSNYIQTRELDDRGIEIQ